MKNPKGSFESSGCEIHTLIGKVFMFIYGKKDKPKLPFII